jgi:tRNA A37 threonylcarbamoyladenosine dehydratase
VLLQHFLDPEAAAALVQEQSYGYLVDAIDSVAPKQALLLAGVRAGCQVVSSMGAGGRLDPSRVRLADISETYNDAFAAVVRRGLRKKGEDLPRQQAGDG